jgi:hypothetical protein
VRFEYTPAEERTKYVLDSPVYEGRGNDSVLDHFASKLELIPSASARNLKRLDLADY